MRICGRLLRPSTLAERRLLLGCFGTTALRVPRRHNIFAVARRIERYVNKNEDLAFLKAIFAARASATPPSASADSPESPSDDEHAAAAE